MVLKNYALGKWTAGEGEGQALYNAITELKLQKQAAKGLDFGEMMDYAREGGPTLRKMTFHERGRMLKALGFTSFLLKIKFYAQVLKLERQN